MSSDKQMLSVAEVFELAPGDDQNATWINPGMRAVVRSIASKKTKTGKDFFPCSLGDEEGAAMVECSFFTMPKFRQGDTIELSGNGLRRTEYNGNAQVAVGKGTEVHIVTRGEGPATSAAPAAAAGAPGAAAPGETDPKWINGQTVGMAMKEAIALAAMCCTNGVTRAALADPLFWADVKTYSGNIIRISRSLELGKLSPPSWPVAKREPEPVKPAPPPPPPRRDPEPANDDDQENVPF